MAPSRASSKPALVGEAYDLQLSVGGGGVAVQGQESGVFKAAVLAAALRPRSKANHVRVGGSEAFNPLPVRYAASRCSQKIGKT